MFSLRSLVFIWITLGLVLGFLAIHWVFAGSDFDSPQVSLEVSSPCGNGICESALGEDPTTCPTDCGGCDYDEICESARGEDSTTCPTDCGCDYDGTCELIRGEDYSNCSDCSPPGGGVPFWLLSLPATEIILQGKAYPEAEITLLSDGKAIAVKKADFSADFRFKIRDITAGTYTFSLWALDKKGRRSITFSFTVNAVKNATTTVTGIFIPPTIELSKVKLKRGEALNIYGQTAPESEINILVEPPEGLSKKTMADKEGDWSFLFDTNILDIGPHTIKAGALLPKDLASPYSEILSFFIEKEVPEALCPNADLNSDGKVDLVDFSILLYCWEKDDACCDQNRNGVVDLPDFSIMMYYWTG